MAGVGGYEMKVTITAKDGLKISYNIERESGTIQNHIDDTVTLNDAEIVGLSGGEVKTLGFLKLRPLAVKVFSEVEPLGEEHDHGVGFALVPPREVRKDVLGDSTVFLNSTASAVVNTIDQYGQLMATKTVPIDTSKLGNVVVEGKTFTVVVKPKTPEERVAELEVQLSAAQKAIDFIVMNY